MNRRVRMQTIAYICVCLLLSFWTGAGVCVCENGAEPALLMNERAHLSAGESVVFFETDLSGEYTLLAFGEGEVEARVTAEGEILAQGTLPLTFSLREGRTATAELSAGEEFTLEWMRAALGRSALTPLDIGEETMSRSLTRAYDVHWLRFTAAQAGEYRFRAARAVKNGVAPRMEVLGADGTPLNEARLSEDAAGAFVTLRAGESCLIRVCAAGEATGSYVLSVERTEEDRTALESPRAALSLQAGQWTHVDVKPETPLLWESDAPAVATVNGEGVVAAQGVGTCSVTAYASGGRKLTLPVTVQPTEVTGVAFDADSLRLSAGEAVFVDYSVQPAFARGVEVIFSSADESVARVSADGLLTAVGEGETEIFVRTAESDFSDRMRVIVSAPKPVRRALAVGIASYADGRSRMGSVNTTQGVADALSQSRYGENAYQTTMRFDLSKKELAREIEEVFAEARESDISLFYINCHGNLFSGLAFLEMHDGSRVSARELENMLRKVPGTVVVVLDCCFSGAFIGKAASADSFAHGVIDVFSAAASSAGGQNAFASEKYKVLVSSSRDQNSFRMASTSPAVESSMSTVFARAFTEAVGWDLIKDQSGIIRADLDDDRRVTLNEIYLYVQRRAMYYLTRSAASTARQCAQVWPEGDTFNVIG